jgi:hypothetical protein
MLRLAFNLPGKAYYGLMVRTSICLVWQLSPISVCVIFFAYEISWIVLLIKPYHLAVAGLYQMVSPFYPSLIFAGKARSLPLEWSLVGSLHPCPHISDKGKSGCK